MDTCNVTDQLVLRQMENEERIIDGGNKEYRKAITKAEEKGQLAETLPDCGLITSFIEPVRGRIEKHVQDSWETGLAGLMEYVRATGRMVEVEEEEEVEFEPDESAECSADEGF